MPAEPLKPKAAFNSRRSFLVKLGLGATALAAVSTPLTRLFRGDRQQVFDGPPQFPEDSIFRPDPKRYPGPRRDTSS